MFFFSTQITCGGAGKGGTESHIWAIQVYAAYKEMLLLLSNWV